MNIVKKVIKRIVCKIRGEICLEEYISCGTKVGSGFWMGDRCRLDWSFPWLITIGDNVTLSHDVDIICHDASLQKHAGVTKLGRVTIGNNVFIGAHAILLPGSEIGEGAIVAAGAVVSSKIPAREIWGGGCPASRICSVDEYLIRNKVSYDPVDASLIFHSRELEHLDIKKAIDSYIIQEGKTYIR